MPIIVKREREKEKERKSKRKRERSRDQEKERKTENYAADNRASIAARGIMVS